MGIASSEEAIIVPSSYYFFNQSKTLGYACPLIGFIINNGKNFVKAFLETGYHFDTNKFYFITVEDIKLIT
jgi:hypothetical protein